LGLITSLSIGTGGLGRFGNQLFTIASCIGIAVKSGQPYGFPKWLNRDNANFGGEVTDFSQHFTLSLPEIVDVPFQSYGYFWGYRDIHLPTGNWSIDAHMQDPRFFEHCMPLIRETFRMKDEPEQNDYVAIHYRAGDYIDHPDAYHPRCEAEYYRKAIMEVFPLDGREYRVFTDNHCAWYSLLKKMNLPEGIRIGCSSQYHTYLEDFKYMKKCKSFITANSSFSFMAALLGEHPEKKIVMPKRWFGTQANIEFDGYPQNAIVI
jgi:hypothetical protein